MYNVLINIATDYMIVFRLQSYDIISKVISVAYGKDTSEIKLEAAINQRITRKRALQPMEKILGGYGKEDKKTNGNG